MRPSPLLLLLVCFSACVSLAQPSPPALQLQGIISLPDYKCALLEGSDPDAPRPLRKESFVLEEGQKAGWLEVTLIDVEKGIVKTKITSNGTNAEVAISLTSETGQATTRPAIQLQRAPLDEVAITLYGKFAKRTVLWHPAIKDSFLTLRASATSQPEAAAVLEKAMENEGIVPVPDGNTFVMLVPKEQAENVHPHAPQAGSRPPNASVFPAGEINFPDMDIGQTMHFYAILLGRQIDPTTEFPHIQGKVRCRTTTPVTKDEAIYALETLCAWHNLKLVAIGTNLCKVVLISGN